MGDSKVNVNLLDMRHVPQGRIDCERHRPIPAAH